MTSDLWNGVEAGRDRVFDDVHGQVFVAGVLHDEGGALGHEDGDVLMQLAFLRAGGDLALAADDVEDLLHVFQRGGCGLGAGGEAAVGEEVGALQDGALGGRSEVIAAGEDVAEDERAERGAGQRLVPVAEEQVHLAVLRVALRGIDDISRGVEVVATGGERLDAGVLDCLGRGRSRIGEECQ